MGETKELPLDYFYKLLERYHHELERKVEDYNTIHVSEAVTCLRRAWYYRMDFERAEGQITKMLMGHGIHWIIESALKRDGWLTEVRVTYRYRPIRLVGTIDAWHPERDEVLEIKTVERMPERPYLGHWRQANAYIVMSGARRGYILYVERGSGLLGKFTMEGDQKEFEKLLVRALELRDALRDQRPPKPEKGPWCNGCPFRAQCMFRISQNGKH